MKPEVRRSDGPGSACNVDDRLTERERREHLFYGRVFERLASRERRRSVMEALGEALDRYRAVLDRRGGQVERERDGKLR